MCKKLLAVLIVTLLGLSLWGCGSNRDSDGDVVTGDDTLPNAATLGIENCFTCHGQGVGQTWLGSVHANEDVAPSALSNPFCLDCHDQLGDGANLSMATGGAQADRPVVGCESCHGGGQFHRGVGPLPFPAPEAEQCGQCHDDDFPHGFSPGGDRIFEQFTASPHAESINEAVLVDGTDNDVRARCSKCHTDEGAKQFLDVDGDYATLTAALPNTADPVENASDITCRTCHRPHQESELLEDATAGRSSEFNTCTNCHQLLEPDSNDKITAYHDPAANPFGELGEIITDTHFATPGDFPGSARGANQNDITGYAMDFSDDDVCLNCHNPHNAGTTINLQWADSAHADKTAAGAWAHYNWTEIAGAVRNDGSATSDRTGCQRCHTTAGVIKLLTETRGDTTAYVPFEAYDPNYKPEMLHCNGCHTDSVGSLREADAITADYTNAPFTYPDVSESNICLACHTGRESGETIKNSTDDFANKSFVNSHYLTAGGTVFAASGYEYDPRDYSIPASDTHALIGTGATGNAAVDAFTGGPCVTCHYSSEDGSHTLNPFTRYAEDDLALNPVCVNCHSSRGEGTNAAFDWFGLDFTPDDMVAGEVGPHRARYLGALEALNQQLIANGFTFVPNHPYFTNTDWVTPADSTGKLNMGAAFNYNLLVHDPGGVAHNRRYTRRLIYDSIDHLDDGSLNFSVAATLNALEDTVPYKANAISYLLNAQNGDAGDRF